MNIKLRKLEANDKMYFFSWVRDREVIRYSLSIFQNMETHEDISNWFDNLLVDKTNNGNIKRRVEQVNIKI